MLHCNDYSRAQAFVAALTEVINTIGHTTEKATTITENQFLDKPSTALSVLEKSRIFVINKCMPSSAYAPDSKTSRMDDIKRERDDAWNEFIQKCETTSETCIIIVGPELILRERFRNNEHLYFRVFRNHLYIEDIPVEDVWKLALKGLEDNKVTFSDEFVESLRTYISIVYPKADLRNKAFIDDLIERLLTKYYGEATDIKGLSPRHIPYYRVDRNYDEVLKAMDDLVGLEKVKETFLEIPYMLQETPKGVVPALHMAFVGNPGTGKTTVAQLAAELLYSMGVIRKNKVITVSALDLIGQYVGETPRITREYCRRAYGGVLFIDEAYLIAQSKNGSNNDQIKQECIGTLLQEMENNRDCLLVIFAGYTKEMEAFLYESNSGLGSRLYKIVEFEDYTDDELMEIFIKMCEKEQYKITREAREKVKLKLSSLRYSRDFGNARTVRSVYLEAKKEYRRLKESGEKVFEERHIVLETGLRDFSTVKQELDEMVGLQRAKEEVVRTIETCRFSKEMNMEIPISKHMLFLGNAGTGKSTVAKLFCQMLFSVGASKSPNCISIAAGDLLGRSNPVESLKEQCRLSSGGVLFIDEAYALQSDSRYCSSCISVLLDVMEEERENITIILAGYETEMKSFLDKNQGLKSRFPVVVKFEDYSIDELTDVFTSMCKKYNFSVSNSALEKFRIIIASEKGSKDFGNARTVRNIFEQSFRLHAEHYMQDPVKSKQFVLDEKDIVELGLKKEVRNPIGFVNA